jgi:PBP1b-binding outer membrane lipoprotein LpoB
MKLAGILILAVLLTAVFISGCVQQDTTPATPGGGKQLTQSEMEDQALQTLEQEMGEAIENMTMEELENELLQQG